MLNLESNLLEASANGASRDQGKRQRKLVRERQRPLQPEDQGKHLWQAVNQARRLIELADHKARYALVVMGVVNAGVFLLATRSDHFAPLVPAPLRPWFSFLVFPFGCVALVFLVDAYNTLRPRPPSLRSSGLARLDVESRPGGLIFWDSFLTRSVEHYQQAWDTVHAGRLNHELAAMAYALGEGIQAKYRALHRLYIELLIIILLTGVMLAVPMFYGFLAMVPK
jgi:hypothetical protein